MRGRANSMDEAVLTTLQSHLTAYRRSWKIIASANVFLFVTNVIFVGYFYPQFNEVKERTVDVRIQQIRHDILAIENQLNAVDKQFADTAREQVLTNTLAAAAKPFHLLANEEQGLAELLSAYLLKLQYLTSDGEEKSEWLYLHEQRLLPFSERAIDRANNFSKASEKIESRKAQN